jgi:outer membrane receptor protein involved in Fe transport
LATLFLEKVLKFAPRCLAALLALPMATAAAEPTAEEEDLTLLYGDAAKVSIATGNLQSLRRAPAVASVVTAADIAAMGATDLDQVLETVAGVHIGRSANSYAPLYLVRGVYSQQLPQVLVMQNGVPVTTLFQSNKGNLWGTFPVEFISRIEVIRGPGSALYGSDAFAGVVNIITKGPGEAPGTEIGARAGSSPTRDAWLQHDGQLGPAAVAAYVHTGSTGGIRRTIGADAQSRNDAIFGTHASQAPGTVHAGSDALDANVDLVYGLWRARANLKLRNHVQSGAGIASALDPAGYAKSTRVIGNLAWADPHFAPGWGLGFAVNTQQYAQEVPSPYVLLPAGTRLPTGVFTNGMIGAPETWERNVRVSAFADYTGVSAHQMRVGVGHDDLHMYRTGELRNFTYAANGLPVPLPSLTDYSAIDPFLRPHRRRIDYLYAQDEWRMAQDWNLTAGVRYDKYSDFGGTTNPRIALVWDATFDLTAKLLYGRAFRAPSYNEAYGTTNPVTMGNPDLKPETNGTLEAALSWQTLTDLQLNATLYRYSMDNIVRLVPRPVSGTGQVYQNTGNQTGRGVELEVLWLPHSGVRVTSTYAWQRSIDNATGKDAGYAPRHHLAARADWQFAPGYLLSPQLNRVAGRQRPAGDLRPPVADYHTVDLALSSRHGKGDWNAALTVRNLFNADVREPSFAPGLQIPGDLPMASRTLTLTLSRAF